MLMQNHSGYNQRRFGTVYNPKENPSNFHKQNTDVSSSLGYS